MGRIWWNWVKYGRIGSNLVEMDRTLMSLGSNMVELDRIVRIGLKMVEIDRIWWNWIEYGGIGSSVIEMD